MGNFISSLPDSINILGTDVPFEYVMFGTVVALVMIGEHLSWGEQRMVLHIIPLLFF